PVGPGLVLAAVAAVGLTVAAGAHRTSTAPDRYTSSSGVGFDTEVQQPGGPPRTSEIAALPAVADAAGATFVFGGLERHGRGRELGDTVVFAGSPRTFGAHLVA